MAHRNRRVLLVDYTYVFDPAFVRVREWIRGGLLGEIVAIRSERANIATHRLDTDVIYDLGVHDVALVTWLLEDSIARARASYLNGSTRAGSTAAEFELHLRNGLRTHHYVNWKAGQKLRTFVAHGTKGTLEYHRDSETSRLILTETTRPRRQVPRELDLSRTLTRSHEPLQLFICHFAECIRLGAESVNLLEETHRLMALDALRQSATQQGTWVDVMKPA
jgi:predicted dehydrogenase